MQNERTREVMLSFSCLDVGWVYNPCLSGLWSITACRSRWFSLCSLFIHRLRFVIAQDLEKETAISHFQRQVDGEGRG